VWSRLLDLFSQSRESLLLTAFRSLKNFHVKIATQTQQLPWKFSLHWIYTFHHSGFLSNLCLPWKTECATVLNIFLHSGFLSNLRLPCYFWLYWIQHTFYIQDFQQFAIALKFFTVLNITFNIQDLGATCACPEKRVCVENFRCIEYNFYI